MNEKDLARAFGNSPENWTESQRRVARQIEYLEMNLLKANQTLTLFRKAAADCWLRDNLTND